MEKIITPDTPFHDEGSIDVGGRRIRNWDGRGLGNIKFEDIIKFSVNTGMASLGLKLGGEKETEYAKRFGFGEATGTDVPGEEVGILYNPRTWSPLTLHHGNRSGDCRHTASDAAGHLRHCKRGEPRPPLCRKESDRT